MVALDAGSATILVALIGAIGAIIVGTVTAAAAIIQAFAKRSEAKDPATVQWITAGQDSLMAALAERGKEIADLRATSTEEIAYLRDQVAQMRLELAEALRHAAECDEQRLMQEAEIRLLRERLDGMQSHD